MSNERKMIVKGAFLAENYDLFVEYRCLDTKIDGKWQFKKEDFTYKPGLSIREEMEYLRDIWNSIGGKIIKVTVDENDELYYSRKNAFGFLDLDSAMSDGDFGIDAADNFEEKFEYTDLQDSFLSMIQINYDDVPSPSVEENSFIEVDAIENTEIDIESSQLIPKEKEKFDESFIEIKKNQLPRKRLYF